MKILCVEDDKNLVRLLETTLVSQHYQVEVATDGQSGWDLAETSLYDLILLDLVLPDMDGIHFCEKLRSDLASPLRSLNHETPVLLMTALDSVEHKVIGLDAGADDFVAKPIDLDELMARIRALLRRNQTSRSPLLHWGDLCLNSNCCEVTFQGEIVVLTAKEYEILELFLRNPDQIFSPSRLLSRLWIVEEMPTEGAVRAQIKGLRQKLKQAGAEDIFVTHYKLGYRLKPAPEIITPLLHRSETVEIERMPALSPELWSVWQECRQNYYDRLSTIKTAIVALTVGELNSSERFQVEQAIHTLIGSLGSFGLTEASNLCRQILQTLKYKVSLDFAEGERLLHQVKTVQQQVLMYDNEPVNGKTEPTLQPEDRPYFPQGSCSSQEATLLVVECDFSLTKLLEIEAMIWGIHTEITASVELAQQTLMTCRPDAILLDLNSAKAGAEGLAFLSMLHTQYSDIPVLVLAEETDFEQRIEAARLGCKCFLPKPITPALVLEKVSQILQRSHLSKSHVLLVDDDPNMLRFLHSLLTVQGYQVTALDKPQDFWQTLQQASPDLVILDVELHSEDTVDSRASLSGIDLCRVLRNDPYWNRLPVLFLSAHTDVETMQQGFSARADDFLSKPVGITDLLTRIRIRLEQRQLWNVTDVDELTGVDLRRKTLKELTRMLQLAQRQQQPLSVAILDLDNFKHVNDQYGHEAGDRVLSYFGQLLRQSFRSEDIVGRWGGEEFVVGLYGTNKRDGIKRLTEVLHQLGQHVFSKPDRASFSVTFSAGIAQFMEDGENWSTLYQRADAALYCAKAQGRNQIVAAGHE